MLARLAQQAGLVEQDVIGLLRAYARDVAGALQIWDPDVPGEPEQPALEPLTTAGVADMLERVLANPLGNKPFGGKTSLAGVQDKIVLARTGEGWNRVIDGWPSTHILKPESRDYPTSIYDEEFGALRAGRGADLLPDVDRGVRGRAGRGHRTLRPFPGCPPGAHPPGGLQPSSGRGGQPEIPEARREGKSRTHRPGVLRHRGPRFAGASVQARRGLGFRGKLVL